MHIDLYIHDPRDPNAPAADHLHTLLHSLHEKVNIIMANQADHAAKLRALSAQLGKSKTEIVTAVDKLKAAIEAGGNSTQEVDDATTELETAVQGLDDLNPDEVPATL